MSIFAPIFFIRTASVGIRTTFGRYTKTLKPGLNFRLPFVQRVYEMPTNIRQNTFKFKVKTKDDAFSQINLAVQYRVTEENAHNAFFSMANPIQQMDSYIENVIRSNVPKMNLKELFEDPDSLCHRVRKDLGAIMEENGYTIMNTLITNIEPDKDIQTAMNRVIASERMKQAATNEAEAEYIKAVRQAEADRDRKRLQGEGIAQQRQAILKGYQDSLVEMRDVLGIDAREALNLTSRTMYYDTLERIGTSNGTRTLFLTHSMPQTENKTVSIEATVPNPGNAVGAESVRQAFLEAIEANKVDKEIGMGIF